MRVAFANSVIKNFEKVSNQVFLTGDLGFMALEEVRDKFGKYFINAGIAEQNMVSVSAALASEGFIPWIYSIAPFITHRPYEQLRNDVCHHNLPVKVVGNGGGYGYGIMGATHHNLEDIGIMRMLPGMRVYVPFADSDVEQCVEQMLFDRSPNYLRLNLGADLKTEIPTFAQWRKIKDGKKGIVIGTGPVVANLFELENETLEDLEIWLVSVFPVLEMPQELKKSVAGKKKLITMEEHSGQCGLYETIAALILSSEIGSIKYKGLFSHGYPSGKYGNQKWHQTENNLQGNNLKNQITEVLK